MSVPSWTVYYDAQGDRPPRPLLLETLDAFGPGEREAIDIGAGAGIETAAILARGWRVFAVDSEQAGIDRLLARVTPVEMPRLRVVLAAVQEVELPTADLVWAGYSVFFVPPDRFAEVFTARTETLEVDAQQRRHAEFPAHRLRSHAAPNSLAPRKHDHRPG